MQKQIRQNHTRYEERVHWAQFRIFSLKKDLWRSFSNRCESLLFRGAEPVFIYQYWFFYCPEKSSSARKCSRIPPVGAYRRDFNISDFSKSVRCLTKHEK